MVVKVKPSEGQDFKAFEVEMVKIDWKKRCELNDKMMGADVNTQTFSFWGEICLEYTKLSEEELNEYSTDEIAAISQAIFEVANRKKK